MSSKRYPIPAKYWKKQNPALNTQGHAQGDEFPRDYVLIAPNSRVRQDLEFRDFHLESFFSEHAASWVWLYFARPDPSGQRRQIYHPPYAHNRGNKQSILERLPNELLENIVDILMDSRQDVLALGLSSHILWPLVLQRAHREHRRKAAPFANKVVAFHGKRSPFTDQQIKDYDLGNSIHCHNMLQELDTFHQLAGHFKDEWLLPLFLAEKAWTELNVDDYTKIKQDLSSSYMYPIGKVWVLRNLTTGQFVRSDKLRPSMNVVPMPWTYGFRFYCRLKYWKRALRRIREYELVPRNRTPLNLAQVLLTSICWSSTPSANEMHLHFQKGRWAGCRFDIVTHDVHLAEEETRTWIDVSKAVASDIGNLRWWVRHIATWRPRDSESMRIYRLDREKHHLSA